MTEKTTYLFDAKLCIWIARFFEVDVSVNMTSCDQDSIF